MPRDRVVLIAETPSLAAALDELLLSVRIDSLVVADVLAAERLLQGHRPADPTVIVAAANGASCQTFVRWPLSPLRDLELIVVGDRYRSVPAAPHVHVQRLPIDPAELLGLVRRLLESRRSVRRTRGLRRLPGPPNVGPAVDRFEPAIGVPPAGWIARTSVPSEERPEGGPPGRTDP